MSVWNAPFLTAEDLRTAREFANRIEQPQDDMPSRWIRALVATVEHERYERNQALIRAEMAEAELSAYREAERKLGATLEDERRAS